MDSSGYCEFNQKYGIKKLNLVKKMGEKRSPVEEKDKFGILKFMLKEKDIVYDLQMEIRIALRDKDIKFNNPRR